MSVAWEPYCQQRRPLPGRGQGCSRIRVCRSVNHQISRSWASCCARVRGSYVHNIASSRSTRPPYGVVYCHPRSMMVSTKQATSIPTRNVRVPCSDLALVWNAAENKLAEQGRQEVFDWCTAAVVAKCMWLACAEYKPPWGRPHPAEAPASRTRASAYEELIEAEYLAAERFEELYPHRAERMPGWGDGVRATLRWAWRGQGPPPIEVDGRSATG